VPKSNLPSSVDSIARPSWARERSRVWIWVVTSVAVLALGVGIPVFSDLTGPGGPLGPTDPTSPAGADPLSVVHVPVPALSSAEPDLPVSPNPDDPSSPGPSGSATPAPTRSGVAGAPAAVALRARYQTIGTVDPLGYQGEVTITNPGRSAVTGWTVTLTLPPGEVVSGASGVHFRQNGATVTFTPIGRGRFVPVQGTVRFTFTVNPGAGGPPVGCAIDDHRCD